MDNKTSKKFLGLQGDPLDAQHDMEAVLYGAVVFLLIVLAIAWKRKKKPPDAA